MHKQDRPNDTEVAAVYRASRLVTGPPIYYGWIILAVATIGSIMSSPGQTFIFSVTTQATPWCKG